MLNILRKHKENLMIKIILGLISIAFIFFFGSSTLRQGNTETNSPATVNGVRINATKAKYLLNVQMEQLREVFKDKVPDGFSQNMKSSVIANLINQELLRQELGKMGLKTTRVELASFIKDSKQFYNNGKFDMNYYQERFLPGYQLTVGSSFETDTMDDLMTEKFFQPFDNILNPSDKEIEQTNKLTNTKFKFSVVKIKKEQKENKEPDPYADSIGPSPEEKAGRVLALWKSKKDISDSLKEYNLKQNDTEELSYSQLKSVFGGKADTKSIQILTSLSMETPFPSTYADVDNFYYVVKLVDVIKPLSELTEENLEGIKEKYQNDIVTDLKLSFIEDLRSHAKIKVFE